MSSEVVKRSVSIEEIDENHDGQRLDNFLLGILKNVPRSKAYQLIRTGQVRINSKRSKPHTKLHLGDKVRVPPFTSTPTEAKQAARHHLDSLQDRIVYEDNDLLIIDKPSGMAVHGGSGISLGVIETLRQLKPNEHFLELAHRLDRETSGCLVIAKNRKTLLYLHGLLRDGKMDKIYHTLVVGQWKGPKKVVMPLSKNHLRSGERVVKVDLDGKHAETHFKLLKAFEHATLLEAKPITGRTHQIRVHAAYMGHAIAMDSKYSNKNDNEIFKKTQLNRLFLHAHTITIPFEDKPPLTVVCELDDNLTAALNHIA